MCDFWFLGSDLSFILNMNMICEILWIEVVGGLLIVMLDNSTYCSWLLK